MLSEGMVLNRALKSAGINVKQSHPHFKGLGKGEGYLVCLGQNGDVEIVEPRSSEELVQYWQLQPDNQKRFPTVKLPCPLAVLPEETVVPEGSRAESGWLIFLRNLAAKSQVPKGKEIKKVGSRLRDYATSLQKDLLKTATSAHLDVFLKVCERSIGSSHETAEDRGARFVGSLLAAAASCRDGLSRDLLEMLLFGKWNTKKKGYEESDVLLYLDLSDFMTATTAACRVYDAAVGKAVNAALLQGEADAAGSDETDICALSGEKIAIEKGKLPNPNLPQLGLTYLFSMNRDAPCHDRYGMIGPDIFSVGKATANEIKDALQYLTQEDLSKQTWTGVPGVSIGSNDLLIAYLERLPRPTRPIPFALLASSPELDEAATFQRYGKLAQEVTRAITDLKLSANPTKELVRFFLLRKVDPGRCQMVMERAITVGRIEGGAKSWEEACANIPDFWLFIPTKAKQPPARTLPRALYPEQVQRALAYQWLQSGERKESIKGGKGEEKRGIAGCPLGDVFDMIFGLNVRRQTIASTLLPLAVSRASPMLLHVGGAMGRDEEREISVPTKMAAIDVYTLIGALLHILKREKEIYMKGAAYQVGRMLSLADTLHRSYCIVVRASDGHAGVPPQLLGNSLMGSALSNPAQALAVLSERVRVYQGWADTVQGVEGKSKSKAVGLAKWVLKELGACAEILAEQELPTRMSDADKAELLIGYLARPASSRSEVNPTEEQDGKES